MSVINVFEKQIICELFGISGGYIFNYLYFTGKCNNNIVQQLIKEFCNIDIYRDYPYHFWSQQVCAEQILNECSSDVVANLLEGLSQYYCHVKGEEPWEEKEKSDFEKVQRMIERLRNMSAVSLPEREEADLKLILSDIKTNIQEGTPELVIDRLHTFTTQYIRDICQKHEIPIEDEKGNYYSLVSIIGKLKKWYEENNYFESKFCVIAIRNTIQIFEEYNNLRNNKSAAHPNHLLQKSEAVYAVKIVADTLMFIDNIEKCKDKAIVH